MMISILLPAWNAEATLPACLASIVRQTERRWECVVVDDGSTDGTVEVARAAAARDARFRLFSTPHRGLIAALQTGLAHCNGPLVARMDADDVMHRERLAAQAAALAAERSLAAVGSHVRLFPRRGLTDGRRAYERWVNSIDSPERVRADAFVECPIAHPTLMIRRELLDYRETEWAEDYDLVLRLLAAGHQVGVVPRRLLAWRDGPARLTRTAPRYALERFTACKAAFLADGFLAGAAEYVLWGHGETGSALRRALLAHGKRPSHIVEVDPRRIGQTIDGAPVVPWEALPGLGRGAIVASVAGAGPRAEIRAALARMGFTETRDFVCAA